MIPLLTYSPTTRLKVLQRNLWGDVELSHCLVARKTIICTTSTNIFSLHFYSNIWWHWANGDSILPIYLNTSHCITSSYSTVSYLLTNNRPVTRANITLKSSQCLFGDNVVIIWFLCHNFTYSTTRCGQVSIVWCKHVIKRNDLKVRDFLFRWVDDLLNINLSAPSHGKALCQFKYHLTLGQSKRYSDFWSTARIQFTWIPNLQA